MTSEFYFFKKNGMSGVVDAIDKDEAYIMAGSGVIKIEPVDSEFKSENYRDFKSENYRDFKIENKNIEDKTNLKIVKLLNFFNNTNKVPQWDKSFVYGVKKSLNNNNKLSGLQQTKLQQIFNKYNIH